PPTPPGGSPASPSPPPPPPAPAGPAAPRPAAPRPARSTGGRRRQPAPPPGPRAAARSAPPCRGVDPDRDLTQAAGGGVRADGDPGDEGGGAGGVDPLDDADGEAGWEDAALVGLGEDGVAAADGGPGPDRLGRKRLLTPSLYHGGGPR